MIRVQRAVFPEYRFPPPLALQADYERRVERGYRVMQGRRAVICGLARDVSRTLPVMIEHVEVLGERFADYRVLIYENDSRDATPEILSEWAEANPRVHLLSERLGAPVNDNRRCLDRAARMAYYRNICQDALAENYAAYDTAVVADMDLPLGFSVDGVAHTFSHDAWDFVGSYGVIYKRLGNEPNCSLHYDAWAFRRQGSYDALDTATVNAMQWRRGEELAPVYSCFGGMGVYRMQALLSARYQGIDCEHVPLHRQMRESGYGRQFLNPSQITLYGRKARKSDVWARPYFTMMSLCTGRPQTMWL